MQVVTPERLHAYVPTVHDRHAEPSALLFVPFGHTSQALAPSFGAYFPGSHDVHVLDSSDVVYVPGEHTSHVDD